MDVVVGRIAKAHGIRGELTVEIRSDSPEHRFAVGAVVKARLRDGSTRPLTVSTSRPHGDRLLMRFDEVLTRDVAETLRGSLLLADTDELPPTDDPDEFYDHQLAGLDVVCLDGSPVGTVRDVAHGAGADLLVIDKPDGGEVLVPFVKAIVPTVDIRAGKVTIDPPEGLLD